MANFDKYKSGFLKVEPDYPDYQFHDSGDQIQIIDTDTGDVLESFKVGTKEANELVGFRTMIRRQRSQM